MIFTRPEFASGWVSDDESKKNVTDICSFEIKYLRFIYGQFDQNCEVIGLACKCMMQSRIVVSKIRSKMAAYPS